MEIHGSYLGPDSRSWSGSDFNGVNAPTELDGTSVTIGGQPAFLSYVSPGQVNAQVPTSAETGSQTLVVTTSAGKTTPVPVLVNGVEPGLLSTFMIVFAMCISNFVVPLILGRGVILFTTNLMYTRFSDVANYPSGAAIGVIMLVLSCSMVYAIAGMARRVAQG